jgi:uncharacterized protein with gpF-like domain
MNKTDFINEHLNDTKLIKSYPKLNDRLNYSNELWNNYITKRNYRLKQLRRLNTKSFARNFRKQQDYHIKRNYSIIKSSLNEQLKYVNKLLIETKSFSRTQARIDKNYITELTNNAILDIWSKTGIGINKWMLKYIDYEVKADPQFLNNFYESIVYQLQHRGSQIAGTTVDGLENILTTAAIEELSIAEASKMLRTEFNSLSRTRATRIARTETIGASNRSSITTVKQLADENDIQFKKIWLATGGTRTRPEHSAASGQKVELDEKFIVWGEELEYPGDINGSGKNIINCRCTTIYESEIDDI